MNTEELAIELGHAEAQELLRSGPLVRLAYNGPDGLPPIGFPQAWTNLNRNWAGTGLVDGQVAVAS